MKEQLKEVREHYDLEPKREWDRLQKRYPYEKYITTRIMDRYIHEGDRILDIGGGPGHYSVYGARKGCDMTLLDLSDGNVKFAKKKARQYGVKFTAVQGNAMDLSDYDDNSFDHVFLMGPLYHLQDEESRIKAINEAIRVLKPGGMLFCSFILIYGGVNYNLRECPEVSEPGGWDRFMYDMTAEEQSVACKTFTHTWMTTVKDVRQLMSRFNGMEKVTMFAQEGILAPYTHTLEKCTAKQKKAWYDYACRFCEKEDYLTHGEHLMYVGKKL